MLTVELTKEEIEMIDTAIYVAQCECQLPETDESDEVRVLLTKLGLLDEKHE